MESLSWEAWRRLPDLRTGRHSRRGSGEERGWQYVTHQAEAMHRRPRPRSCIEGGGSWQEEDWLHHLERMKSGPTPRNALSLAERTVSTPSLEKEATDWARSRHSAQTSIVMPSATPRRAHSLRSAPLCGRDVSSPRWHRAPEPTGRRETARYRLVPGEEVVTACPLTAVRCSWLPMQTTAVMFNLPSRSAITHESPPRGTLKPGVHATPAENVIKKNNLGEAGGDAAGACSPWPESLAQRSPSFTGHHPTQVSQVEDKGTASLEGPSPVGQEFWLKTRGWICHDGAQIMGHAVPSTGYLYHRRMSAPECPPNTAPPGVSIPPKARTGFSSITIASRRVPLETATEGTQRGSTSTQPSDTSPLTEVPGGQPVLRRRKATVIKVTECRQSYTASQELAAVCLPTFRHSYSDSLSLRKNQASSVGHTDVQSYNPPGTSVHSTHFDSFHSDSTYSNSTQSDSTHSIFFPSKQEDQGDGQAKVHRSTVSFILRRPSSGDTAQHDRRGGGAWERRSRPLSFAGGFGCTDIRNTAGVEQRRASLEVPGKNNIDSAGGIACSSDVCVPLTEVQCSNAAVPSSQPCQGAMQGHGRVPAHLGTSDQGHPALRNVHDCAGCLCPDMIQAINAAAVIANIKRQMQLNKTMASRQAEDVNVSHENAKSLGPDRRAPHDDTRIPRDDTRIPHDDTRIPHSDTKIPHDDTRIPYDDTRIPYDDTRIPHDDTRIPHSDPRIPHDDTRIPHSDTKIPHDDTRIPHDDTRMPHDDTKTCHGSARHLVKDDGITEKTLQNGNLVKWRIFCTEGKKQPNFAHKGSHPDPLDSSQTTLTLKEALERFRPDFIRRSKGRLKELQRRAQERRALLESGTMPTPIRRNSGRSSTRPDAVSDNLPKAGEQVNTGERVRIRPRWNCKLLPETKKRRKAEDRKKVEMQSNRLRAEVFKKKLLDQILQRKSN